MYFLFFIIFFSSLLVSLNDIGSKITLFEPQCEKTGHTGFRPGLTQSDRYHTRLTRYILQALIYDLRLIAFTTKCERPYY